MGHFFTASPDMKLVNAFRYDIPVETDIVSTIMQHGMTDHVVGGPGLTSDVLGLKKQAGEGRLYLLISQEADRFVQFYENAPHAERTDSTFEHLFVCSDGKYATAVVDPNFYGLQQLSARDTRLTNKDCMMQFLEANLQDNIHADGTYVYMPEDLDIETKVAIVNEHAVMNKFDQIYLKCYERLGFSVGHDAYTHAWKWLCTKAHRYTSINDTLAFNQWREGLKDEPLTYIS